ncbi:Hint domain-containing protein [Acetobacter musti]|uniref:Hint domain-containing protein n=1 Tax=Acetobacter musti TaxID=864732 RepID=UPI001886C854|nr:Hint domain-containing protein [Acetobacter musti]
MIVQEGTSTLDLTGAGPVLSAFSGTLCVTNGTLLVSDPAQIASATVDFMSGYSGTLVVSDASALPGAITDFSPGDKIELASLNWQSGMTTKLVSGNTLDILSPDGSVAGSVSLGSATYSYSTFELTSGSDGGTTLSFAAGSPPGITASRIVTEDTSNFVMPSHTTIAFAPGVTVSGITIGQPFPAVVSDTPTEADIYGTVTNAVAGYTILAADVSSDILVDESGASSYSATIDLWSNEIVDAGGNSYNSTIEGGRQSVYGNSYNAMCGSIASNSEISGASQIIYAGGTSYGAHFTSTISFGMIDDTVAVPSTQTILSGGTAVDTVMDGISNPWVINPYGSGYYQLNAISTETVESGATAIHTTIDQDGAVYAASGATLNNIVLHGGLLSISTGTIITGGITYTSGTIDVTDLKYAGSGSQQISVGADNILTITEGDVTRQIALLGDYSGSFSVSAASDGSTRIDYGAPAPCYCRGTLIATETGETPVEDLKTGDHVRTASGALRPIRWIGYRSYDGRFARGNPDLIPVVFTKGSLGNALPRRDLTVSPLHAMFIDGYLIPAHCLLNGTTIRRGETGETLEYFHVELETHDVLLAEGAPSESFVDDHSRNMFHNAASFAELWPDHEPEPAQYCAPRLEDGATLEHIRARLALPESVGTTNSAVTIHIDSITARSIEGHVTLPHGATDAPALDVFMDETFIGSVLPDRPADKPGDRPATRRFVFGLPRRIALTGNECFRVRESQTSARAKAA